MATMTIYSEMEPNNSEFLLFPVSGTRYKSLKEKKCILIVKLWLHGVLDRWLISSTLQLLFLHFDGIL